MYPVFVINLDRSKDRWETMLKTFPLDNLQRIRAVDGRQWELGGKTDDTGRVLWDPEKVTMLKDLGVLGDHPIYSIGGTNPLWPGVPCDLGCTLSHAKIWRKIYQEQIPWAVILEDDTEPTEFVANRRLWDVLRYMIPMGADVVLLSGHQEGTNSRELDRDGQFIGGFGTEGYAISWRGAEVALHAEFPMYETLDRQWFKRGFLSCLMKNQIPLPPVPYKVRAYGLREPIIRISAVGDTTTFSHTGNKEWHLQKGKDQ